MKNAIDTALYFLKFRARTIFEIRQKLQSKNFPEEEINKTIDVLARNELLDDAKFVKMYIKDRNNLKPTGSYLLRLELKRLGVPENLVEEVMAGQNEEELARRAIESKHRYREADFPKQAQFLQRRGFSMSVIMKVLKSR
jgi:regulatory protein